MHDIERIAPFLAEFEKLWKKEPDLRFGQLVVVLQSRIDPDRDPFYTEDDVMLGTIREMSTEISNRRR